MDSNLVAKEQDANLSTTSENEQKPLIDDCDIEELIKNNKCLDLAREEFLNLMELQNLDDDPQSRELKELKEQINTMNDFGSLISILENSKKKVLDSIKLNTIKLQMKQQLLSDIKENNNNTISEKDCNRHEAESPNPEFPPPTFFGNTGYFLLTGTEHQLFEQLKFFTSQNYTLDNCLLLSNDLSKKVVEQFEALIKKREQQCEDLASNSE